VKLVFTRRYLLLLVLTGLGVAPALHGQTTGGPYQFYTVNPCRVLAATPIAGGATLNVTVKTRCGVPTTAKAAVINVAVVSPTADGFISVWPAGTAYPGTSMMNFRAGEPALANGAIASLGVGTPDLSVAYGTAGGGTTNVIIDITGYFQ